MSKGDLAKENFLNGYNCSQAVVKAFEDEKWFKDSGMTIEAALKMAESFGGGMGGMREVCGAVSGMFMMAGLANGDGQPKSPNKQAHYKVIKELAGKCKEENGSIICGELLGIKKNPDVELPGKKKPCAELCKLCADFLEGYLKENNK